MSVFKHGKSWWYDFRSDGVRYRERTPAANRDSALQLEAIRKAQLSGQKIHGKRQSRSIRFAEFAFGDFSCWCSVEHKDRPSTYARYMRSVKALNTFFRNHTLHSIDPGMVEHYKIQRSQQPRKNARDGRSVTPAAVNRDLAVLRILFNYAVRLGIVAKNPVAQVRFFRERNRCTRVLSVGEEAAYLKVASPLLRDVATIMLETGMRPGEIYRLCRDDVDIDLRSVHVRTGKTDNAARYIPLTERAFGVLSCRVRHAHSEWLFPSPHDPSTPVLDVRKAHDGAVARAKIAPRFRLYDLRHTALTRMAMSGIDLPTLKELAGHSQIQMTMRYVHPTPEHKRRAMERFEEFLRTPVLLKA